MRDSAKAKNPRIIITSRGADLISIPQSFTRLQLLPFTDEQLSEFFSKWFGESKPHKLKEIQQFLKTNAYIKEVCRSPMVATLVAALVENGYELPQSKCEIYEKKLDLMLNRWDRSRGVTSRTRINTSDKTRLLTRLALSLHSRHEREFKASLLEKIWKNGFSHAYPSITIEELLWELRFSNNVIIPESLSTYTLGHLSYQEYLCAKAIVFSQNVSILIGNFHNPWWRQVLIFYAGIAGDLKAFASQLLAKYPLTYKNDLLAIMMHEARYTTNEVKDTINMIGDETLESLYEDFDEDQDEMDEFQSDENGRLIIDVDAEDDDKNYKYDDVDTEDY